jgi:class 3 adenylate cyclase
MSAARVVRAVAFVDLCGFTAYADAYGAHRAYDVVAAMRHAVRQATWSRSVQVVKWLGDGAMLTAKDPADLGVVERRVPSCPVASRSTS